MAKYHITNLNYLAAGANRFFLNMDICLGYEIYDYVHLLCAENETSGYTSKANKLSGELSDLYHDIGTEHGKGYWYPTRYIAKSSDSDEDDPLAKEKFVEEIILNEQQDHYIESDPSSRKYIRLYLSCCTETIRQKIKDFNLEREQVNCTYLLDKGENDKNIMHTEQYKIYDMYDIRDVTLKKQGTHQSKNAELYNTDYHHDIYAPSMPEHPIGFCQSNLGSEYLNDAILLTQNQTLDPSELKTTLLSSRGTEASNACYNSNIESNDSKIYLYCDKNSQVTMMSSFIPTKNLLNVQKSYVIDIPVDSYLVQRSHESDIADYDLGLAYFIRMHTTKSAYNSTYSMEMPNNTTLARARTYCGIGVSGGRPYLKYYDDSTYSALSVDDKDGLALVDTKWENSTSGSKFDKSSKPFQKIEYLFPIDYANEAKHKSNVFTVNILSTNIGTITDKINEKIENDEFVSPHEYEVLDRLETLSIDIAHAVRDIARHITPANTQLFDVYLNDDRA